METRLDMPRIRTGGSWCCFTSTLTPILAGAAVPGESLSEEGSIPTSVNGKGKDGGGGGG